MSNHSLSLAEVVMQILLEHVCDDPNGATFRIAFHSSSERWLLPYPKVTGLTFTDASGVKVADWTTDRLVSEPLDDFVLTPDARIAFDLHALINIEHAIHNRNRWVIRLPADPLNVHFNYDVDRDTEWYDYLAKRSRFAAITPIWRGALKSNTITYRAIKTPVKDAK